MRLDLHTDLRKALRRGLELPISADRERSQGAPAGQKPKTSIGWLRSYGITHLIADCGDLRCSQRAQLNIANLPDQAVLSELAKGFCCTACGHVGGYIKPEWSSALKNAKLR